MNTDLHYTNVTQEAFILKLSPGVSTDDTNDDANNNNGPNTHWTIDDYRGSLAFMPIEPIIHTLPLCLTNVCFCNINI